MGVEGTGDRKRRGRREGQGAWAREGLGLI